MLFQPGQIVATPGALELAEQGVNLLGFPPAPPTRRLGRVVPRGQSRERLLPPARLSASYRPTQHPAGRFGLSPKPTAASPLSFSQNEY